MNGEMVFSFRLIGLFPTLEQLELLAVLIDFRVKQNTLHKFWKRLAFNEWGVEVDMDECNGNGGLETGHSRPISLGISDDNPYVKCITI